MQVEITAAGEADDDEVEAAGGLLEWAQDQLCETSLIVTKTVVTDD